MMRTRKQLPSAPTVVDVAKDMQAAVWAYQAQPFL
jgi:hypothetical protein